MTGTSFLSATGVKFGATAGTSLTVLSDTQLTIVSPGHAVGQIDVTVTNPTGTSTANLIDKFTFVAPILPVQQNLAGNTTSGNTNTLSLTLPANVTPGNALVLVLADQSTNATVSTVNGGGVTMGAGGAHVLGQRRCGDLVRRELDGRVGQCDRQPE